MKASMMKASMMKASSARDDESDDGSRSVGSMSYDDARIMTPELPDDAFMSPVTDREHDDHDDDNPNDISHDSSLSSLSGFSDLGKDFGFTWKEISDGSKEKQIAEMKDAIIQLQTVFSNLIEFDRPIEGGVRKTRMKKRFNRKGKSRKGRKGKK